MQAKTDSPAITDRRLLSETRVILAITTVLMVVVAYPMWIGEVYSAGDLSVLYMPNRQFYAQCLAAGDSPLWFPGNFGGYYLHGTGQTGMFLPLHYIGYRWLPFSWAFNLEVWMSYPLMFVGVYWLLRRRRLPRSEALFGAMLFTFSAFNIMRLRHLNALAIVARIPWVLVCVDLAARSVNRRHVAWAAAGLAVLNASQLLQGYPQYFWFSSMLVAFYVILLICERAITVPRITILVAATALGVAASAVQLLPTLEAAHDSVRTQHPDASRTTVGSLPPRYLAQALSAYSMKVSHNVRIYVGAVLTLLSVWAVVRNRHFGAQRGLVVAAATLAVVMVWMSLGEHGYYSQLMRPVPFIGDFRFPSRCLVLFTFACCVLSALALGDLRSLAKSGTPAGKWAVAAMIATTLASCAVTAIGFRNGTEATQNMPGHVILGSAYFVVGCGLILLAARGCNWAFAPLIVLAVADPAYYGLDYAVFGKFETIANQWVPNHMPLNAELQGLELPPEEDQSYRLVGGPQLVMVTNLGWNRLDGMDGIPPNKLLDYRKLPSLRVAGAKWVNGEAAHVSFFNDENSIYDSSVAARQLGHPRNGWYEVPGVVPRARCVSRVVVSQQPDRDLENIDVVTTALVDEPLDLGHAAEPADSPVVVMEDRPGKIQVRVESRAKQLLVLTESYHPGWRVDIDGQAGPTVRRVNGDFLGCVVEPGPHVVTFEFAPTSTRRGLLVSLAATGSILLLFLVGVFSKSRAIADGQLPG